jgi:hypothetical protein
MFTENLRGIANSISVNQRKGMPLTLSLKICRLIVNKQQSIFEFTREIFTLARFLKKSHSYNIT